jgi:hypothetical protein
VILLVTDALVDEHFRDRGGQFTAEIAADQMQHHIKRRGATGAGEAVTVKGEQLSIQGRTREGFLHRHQTLPVHTAIVTVQQTCASQRPTAGTNGAEAARLTSLALQS